MKSFHRRFSTSVYSVFNALILFSLPLLFLACKKDSDEESPKVIIQSPYENQTFLTTDTILVVVSATDNEQVKSIVLELLDSDYNLIGSQKSYAVSGASVQFAIDYALDQPFLPSGSYFLAARASDGANIGSGFTKIQLTAIPRVIDQFLVITKTSGSARILSGTNFSTWTERLQVNTHFKAAALNSRQNVLGLTGGDSGDANFYETDEFTLGNSIPNYGSPSLDYFLGLDYNSDSERFILLQNDPQYRVLDKYGNPLLSGALQPGFRPQKSFQTDDKVYIDQKSVTSSSRILSSFTYPGHLINSFTVSGTVKSVTQKNTTEDYVWIDAASGTQLALVNETSNLLATAYERPGEKLYSVADVSQGIFIIATSTGIYRFSYLNGTTVVLNQNLQVSEVYYEPLDGMIYATHENALYRLTSSGQLVDSKIFADPIAFFGIDYNR